MPRLLSRLLCGNAPGEEWLARGSSRNSPPPRRVLLRNQLSAGIVDVTEYGVRGKRGDFEPLISEELFFRVQAVLSGHVPSTTSQPRPHPDLRAGAFVRCDLQMRVVHHAQGV